MIARHMLVKSLADELADELTIIWNSTALARRELERAPQSRHVVKSNSRLIDAERATLRAAELCREARKS